MKISICPFILLLLFITQLSAQNIIKKDTIKNIKLDEVIVTAQYAPTSEKNAIYKVKVINSKLIEAKSAINLTELLRQEANIEFSFNPAFGAGIEMNGISKENIKILIDGVPVIGRVNGVLNFNQININNIERIEIIEGPLSVFYGTDALGATINLITKKEQAKEVNGSINLLYENINAKSINGSVGVKFSNNLIRINGGTYLFEGLNTDDENTRSQNWPTREQYNTSLKYIRKIGNFNLNFSSILSKENVNTLGEISSRSNKATDVNYTTKRWDNSLNFQGKIQENNYINLTVSYLNYDRFDTSYQFNAADNSSQLIVNNPNENANYFDTFFSKGQYSNNSKDKKLNYTFGLEFESNVGKGNRILDNKKVVENTSVFGSLNFKLTDKLEIQPALRYTYNSSFKGLYSPAINAKYKFNNAHTIRVAYGKGFRAPSIKELYLDWSPTFGPITYTFKGNENLEVELSNNYNLNYTFRKNLQKESYLQLEASVAYNEIKNLIGLSELVNFERHYLNLNKIKTINTTIAAKYKFFSNLNVNLAVNYLGRFLEYSKKFNSGKYLYTPNISSSISYTYNPFNLDFNVYYKYSGDRQGHYIDENTETLIETTRNGFSNLDVSIAKRFLNNKLSVSIGGKNLFDVKNIETFNQIGVAHERDTQFWGASFYVGTRFKF